MPKSDDALIFQFGPKVSEVWWDQTQRTTEINVQETSPLSHGFIYSKTLETQGL